MPVGPLTSRDLGRGPLAPTAEPLAAAGTGILEFAYVCGETVLTRAFTTSPLKVLNPSHAGQSAWAYLATYGGGLVDGDTIAVHLDVGRGAAALVATQASTKVYRSPHGAAQTLLARVANDGLLVLLPDPVTCFSGARYRQEQRVLLDSGASLVLVDRLTAGRIDFGERWLFEEYNSRMLIWRGDRLVLHDAFSLTRDEGDVARRLDRFNCLAAIVLVGPLLAATAAHLVDVFRSAPVIDRADVLVSAAPLGDDGALLRFASCSTEQIAVALRQHLGILIPLLGDDPWIGK